MFNKPHSKLSIPSISYMPQLDGLRTIAVALVALSHWLPYEYHFHLPLGAAGVQLFFVLSGFLITGILLKCRDDVENTGQSRLFAVRNFYIRRFLRIFPLYYGVILFATLVNLEPFRETFFWNVTYLTNFYFYFRNEWHGTISHFWSLAVEEQFYLIWPWIVLFAPRHRLRSIFIFLIISAPVFRIVLSAIDPTRADFVGILPMGCFDALVSGALLALIRFEGISSNFNLKLFGWACFAIWGGFYIMDILDYSGPIAWELQHTVMVFSFVAVIGFASVGFSGWSGRLLSAKPMVFLGTISYGLYVLHLLVSDNLPDLINRLGLTYGLIENLIPRITIFTLVTIVASMFTWFAFEKRLNGLKRHFPYVPRLEKLQTSPYGNKTEDTQLGQVS